MADTIVIEKVAETEGDEKAETKTVETVSPEAEKAIIEKEQRIAEIENNVDDLKEKQWDKVEWDEYEKLRSEVTELRNQLQSLTEATAALIMTEAQEPEVTEQPETVVEVADAPEKEPESPIKASRSWFSRTIF